MAPESSNVVALRTKAAGRRKRGQHQLDPQRLRLAHDMPEMALSSLEVCALIGGICRRHLLRLRKLPDFPPAFQYHPGGRNYWRAGQVMQWKDEHSGP